jgi:pimeloyl-ACP methyl ester carboxylesterase
LRTLCTSKILTINRKPPVGPSQNSAPPAAGQLASANVESTTPAIDHSASDSAASVTRPFYAEPRAKTGREIQAPDGEPTFQEAVLLIHGIRDFGEWEQMVSSILEEPGTRVLPLSYGRFDAVRFWFPIWTRDAPVKKLLRRIRDAHVRFPKAKLSVIAHSFGTYAIGKILRENPDIRLHRLILCGAIIPSEFRWDQIPHSVEKEIINDCGIRDIWRYLAGSRALTPPFKFSNIRVKTHAAQSSAKNTGSTLRSATSRSALRSANCSCSLPIGLKISWLRCAMGNRACLGRSVPIARRFISRRYRPRSGRNRSMRKSDPCLSGRKSPRTRLSL